MRAEERGEERERGGAESDTPTPAAAMILGHACAATAGPRRPLSSILSPLALRAG